MIGALASFPNTLWVPVLIALAIKNTFIIVVVNYVIFFVAVALLKKSYSFSTGTFVAFLLLNATTTISLLSVNKEIIDLLAVSLFLFASRKGRRSLVLLALLLALLNRYEVFIVMVVFLLIQTKLNPWRHRRALTLVSLTIALSVVLPLALSRVLASRFEEASSGGVIVLLDSLEMHFLYGLAVVPKVAENLFGMLINPAIWKALDNFSDLANSYILLVNNLATAVVVLTLIKKHALSIRSDLIYFAMIGCILMAISLVIQPGTSTLSTSCSVCRPLNQEPAGYQTDLYPAPARPQVLESIAPVPDRTAFDVLAVIVLYKMRINESAAFRTLMAAKSQLPRQSDVRILLYDNSSEAHDPGTLPAGVQYEAPRRNAGLAAAYNRALAIAESERCTWLLTLDQDTTLPSNFLSQMGESALNLEPDDRVAAIVPCMTDAGRDLSPVLVKLFGEQYSKCIYGNIRPRDTCIEFRIAISCYRAEEDWRI